jgi:soluble lytic murein transglycosylase-like protein
MDGRGSKFSKICICSAIFIFTAVVSSVNADIYRYIDEHGVMHFTNAPTSNQYDYKVFIKEKVAVVDSVSDQFYSTDKYDHFISDASKQYGVDSRLLKAMIKAESDFDPRAISKKGAMGLMQIMPENFKMLELKNPFDPWENIKAGARYLKTLHERFNGKLALTLAAYNAGPTAVDRYKNIPPFQETEEYVRRVLRYYRTFQKL